MSEQITAASTERKSRPRKRRPAVPLPGPWRNSSWVSSFGGKGASPIKYQEVSPSFLLRQLLVLIEKGKFVDASQLLNKISIDSLKEIILDIPIEPVIESVPQSLVVLESLYSRLFLSDVEIFPVEQFQVEAMVFHIVRYISMIQSSMEFKYPKPEDARKSIINILRIVLHVNPDLVRTLFNRKKLMDTALQGIGEHGLIQMNGSLIDLHDGLKSEIGKTIQAYKGAVNTLDHLNLSHSKPVKLKSNSDKKFSQGNHQALTKLNENQIKNRLYKNKSLLNAIELRMNSQLPTLIKTLKDRIEYDKSALLAFGKLKTEIKTFSSNAKVVPLIAQYSKSLQTVLDIFKELLDEHCGSDQSSYSTLGYHSDEEDIISLHKEDEDKEEDLTKEAVVMEIEVHQEIAANVVLEGPSIEQIFAPTINHHEQSSLPVEPPAEKRSRWWKHHQRSHSLESSTSTQAAASNGSNEAEQKRPLRSSSMDPIVISRPRKESVEESAELKQMLTRIRKMSASSPAVGRRQLEKRGISQPRSRDSSLSPSVLRKHYFGGEKTPSISSQMDDAKDDDPDPTYATLKFKNQSPSNTDKDSTKAEASEAISPDPLYAKIKAKGKRSKGKDSALDDPAVFMLPPDLEQLDPTQLAKIEAELSLENERLIKQLQMNSIGMQKLKEAQEKAASKGASTPDLKKDKLPVIIQQTKSSNSERFPADQGGLSSEEVEHSETAPSSQLTLSDESTKKRSSSPSFVEQQVAVLEKQGAESVSQSVPQKSLWKLEEVSVQQGKEFFERQLMSTSEEATPAKANLESLEEGKEKPAEEKSVEIVDSAKPQQKEDTEPNDREQKDSIDDQPGQLKEEKPDPVAQQESAAKVVVQQDLAEEKPDPVAQQESAAKVVVQQDLPEAPSTEKQPAAIPPTENQISPSLGDKPTQNGPTKTVPKQEDPVQMTRNNKVKSEVPKKLQVKPPSAKEVEASALPTGLQPAAIEQTSSPALQPKSASLIKQKGMGSHQRSQQTTNKGVKFININRHLPKNHIRHITGDLLYVYDKLYTEQRAIAWTGLTIDPQKKDVVLFSVIVFAFRSAQITIHELHMAKARMQQLPTDDEESVSSYTIDIPPNNKSQVELLQHLRKMGNTFDLSPMIADVLDQVYDLSDDYNILEGSAPLKKFVTSCVSIAWKLSIQSCPYVIDFELRSYDPSVHQRTSSSSRRSSRIMEHLWPALLESSKGMVVYKGVVVT